MRSEVTTFGDIFYNSRQIKVPIYQRLYSWDKEEYEQLWDDIIKISKDSYADHFVGTIVCTKEETPAGIGTQYTVIDGQQRLTTISLLVAAWCRKARESGVEESKYGRMQDTYVKDRFDMYKMALNKNDMNTYVMLVEGNDLPEDKSKCIENAYAFFKEKLDDNDVNIDEVYRGICGLSVGFIELGNDRKMAQGIFESLNSKGKPLAKADLIRNFVLMQFNEKEAENIYNTLWSDIESKFRDSEDRFDDFIKHYLAAMTHSQINKGRVYYEFKRYSNLKKKDENKNMRDILVEMRRYAVYYKCILDGGFEGKGGENIDSAIDGIRNLKSTTSHPFLLRIADCHYNEKSLSMEDFVSIVNMLESYLCRRIVCNLHANRQIRVFNKLIKGIKNMNSGHLAKICEVFYEIRNVESERFPTDEEFMKMISTSNTYKAGYSEYILRKLEESKGSKVLGPKHTVEHIMPQTLDKKGWWEKHLGDDYEDIHAKYLHRIGNLTLTIHNPELDNKSLPEKRDYKDGGYANSGLNLDDMMREADEWNTDVIDRRGHELARWAVNIWKYPDIEINRKNGETNKISVDDFLAGKTHSGMPSVDESRKKLYHSLIEKIEGELQNVEFEQKVVYGRFKIGNRRFCMIKTRASKLMMIYCTKKIGFADGNEFIIPIVDSNGVREFKSVVEGDFISWIKTEEDVESTIAILRTLYRTL